MKKIITFAVLLLSIMSVHAQECILCGDWHSSKVSVGEMGYIQIHMRIKKSGDKYYIRVKDDVIKNGETMTNYWENSVSYNSNGKVISWENCSLVDNEWNNGERFNGIQIRKAIHYRVCSANVEDDIMHFQFRVRIDYFSSNNNFIGSEWASNNIVTHDLFKDDNDW